MKKFNKTSCALTFFRKYAYDIHGTELMYSIQISHANNLELYIFKALDKQLRVRITLHGSHEYKFITKYFHRRRNQFITSLRSSAGLALLLIVIYVKTRVKRYSDLVLI